MQLQKRDVCLQTSGVIAFLNGGSVAAPSPLSIDARTKWIVFSEEKMEKRCTKRVEKFATLARATKEN